MPQKKIIITLFLCICVVTLSWFFNQHVSSQSSSLKSFESSNKLLNSISSIVSNSQIPEIKVQNSESSSSSKSSSSLSISSAPISSSISSSSSSKTESINSFSNFSGIDFQQIFESIIYSKIKEPPSQPIITDNPVVDNHIRNLGEKRGYKKRGYAIESELVGVDGQRLQTEVKEAWLQLKQKANESKINLVLVSGYRSPTEQRSMFVSTLAPEYVTQDLIDGKVDGDLNSIMNIVSPPGYSRHHTGFTMDLACGGEAGVFRNTSCYQWVKKNNFANIREFGLIPSYPEGVPRQGPRPEEWEFVWVGDLAR